jgi:hypothetical protein
VERNDTDKVRERERERGRGPKLTNESKENGEKKSGP